MKQAEKDQKEWAERNNARCWCGSSFPCSRPERHLEVPSAAHPLLEGEPFIPASVVRTALEMSEDDDVFPVHCECDKCGHSWAEPPVYDRSHVIIADELRKWLA